MILDQSFVAEVLFFELMSNQSACFAKCIFTAMLKTNNKVCKSVQRGTL